MFGKVNFKNKKILIYGLGLSGNSCYKYLSSKNKISIFDDNYLLKNSKNRSYFLNKNKILKLKFDFIIVSPGIDIKKGKLKIQAKLDLHGFTLEESKEKVAEFVLKNYKYKKRLLLVITGKGKRLQEKI